MDFSTLETQKAPELLAWAAAEYGARLGLASSFGMEDMVLIDMVARQNLPLKVFTLDTGRLPEETYELMDKVRNRYGIEIHTYFPDREAVERLVREKGFYSFRESVENRKECCAIRKVEPLGRALEGLQAWITGMRREQSITRTDIPKVQPDEAHPGLIKINPLADWSDQQVKDYLDQHQVPINALHKKNYPSIGCAPCTRPILEGEDIRAGRWWWENPEHKECGLHRPR